ncbi:MAG: type II secretion system protein [Candidatus Omnitrophota bacterium]|nr:MAG: type II secretion system protein [Candidatus Omnitrophota bacterium]
MKGFTLLEILIVIVIFTIGVVILLGAISTMIRGSGDIESIDIATNLARDMMDEILAKGFDDPDGSAFGLEETEPRNNFDDVDDYDGWSKNPPQDVNGTPYDGTDTIPDYSAFTRAVTVENVPENDFDIEAPSTDGTTDAKRIVVTVSWAALGGNPSVELKSVATEYHPDPR